MTTFAAALASARTRLQQGGIEDAEIEAEVLLRHVLNADRAHFYQNLQTQLAEDSRRLLLNLVRRRLQHEPSAYITGQREFFGLDFLVTRDVLIPRPETETMVEAALELAKQRPADDQSPLLIADVGTGSGAVAVSLAVNLPAARIVAIDSSTEALALARQNARLHRVEDRIEYRHGTLLDPLDGLVDLIVANLPYVKTIDWFDLPLEIRLHEPQEALDGGPDGLAFIRPLLEQAPGHLRPGGAVCLEFGSGEQNAVLALAQAAFPAAVIRPDLAGRPRVVIAR